MEIVFPNNSLFQPKILHRKHKTETHYKIHKLTKEGKVKEKLQFLMLVKRTNTNSIFKTTNDCVFIISNYPIKYDK